MKKLSIFLILPFFVICAQSQDLDEKFLESLPEDMRQDVLNRSINKESDNKNVYRPSTYSSKLDRAEDLLILKERMELDLLELNRRLSNDEDISISKELKLFGQSFFNSFQTSFMPINEPNPDSTYMLDVGDILKIQLIGQENYTEEFLISGNGSINLPDIGEVILAGLNINEASLLLKSKIALTYIGSEAFISIDTLRDVNILVTGNAKNPGIYTLNGNSNILHALFSAGGVGEYGSFREINLIRDNKVVETLDIYDLLIDGNYNLKKRLRSGDVVFVEPTKNIVTIDGAVKRPAKYELHEDQYLGDVIRYANGIKTTVDINNISLERILDGTLKTIPILNQKQFDLIIPVDGDLVYLREFPYRKAKITGAVKKPGFYTMAAGETLEDLIQKAGGFNKTAYPDGAIYLNKDAKAINKMSKDILYEEFLDNIIAISQKSIGQNFDLTPIIGLTREIKNSEPNGRIVVDLVSNDPDTNSTIKDGDELFIPEKTNNIYVYGEVSSEGAVIFESNKNLEYFIDKTGGYKKYADTNSIYVMHPNGESERYSIKRNIFESRPKNDINLYPGSIIFVPRKIDESSSQRLAAQAYVSILGNIGIALASLSSINNN